MQENPYVVGRTKDVAVYIDYENLYISLRSTVRKNPDFDLIIEKCRDFGRVTVSRAYADWSEFARVVTSQMFSSGVEPIYVPTRKFYDEKTRSQATKNSVDIHITIDIIKDVLTSKNIDTFVLVSGDRDFVPLMNQIRAAGKEVYAIGVAGCTSSELAVAVDGMFYYHQLLQSDEEIAAEHHDVYAKLTRAVEIARARKYRSTLGVVKPIMREIVSNFDETRFRNSKGVPFKKFQDFVHEAEQAGFVKTTVPPGGGALEIWLQNENPDEIRGKQRDGGRDNGDEAPPRNRRGRGRRTADQAAAKPKAEPKAEPKADEKDEQPAEPREADGDEAPSGRRRTRRGGRGGRRRRKTGEVAADAATEAEQEAPAETPEPAPAEDQAEAAPAAEADAEPKPRRRRTRRRSPAPADEPQEAEGDAAASAKPAKEAEAEAEAPAPGNGGELEPDASAEDLMSLPTEAHDDLRKILEEFGNRAPSQRRLIARLKKASTDGELEGDYREGQFLLMVRKGLESGWVEKVSKGFYSGIRWADEGAE